MSYRKLSSLTPLCRKCKSPIDLDSADDEFCSPHCRETLTAAPAATPMTALRAGLIELCDEWESEKEIQEPTERSEWYEMALKRCARSVKMLLGLWPPKSGQPAAAQPQRESEIPAGLIEELDRQVHGNDSGWHACKLCGCPERGAHFPACIVAKMRQRDSEQPEHD